MTNNPSSSTSPATADETGAMRDALAPRAPVRPYDVANDDGVSADALSAGLAAAAKAHAANDDGFGADAPANVPADAANDNSGDAGLPPAPGAASVPRQWLRDDPHVATLRRALETHIATVTTETERRVLGYLLRVVDADGELPSVDGRICYNAMRRAGIGEAALYRGRKARLIIDRYAPSFRLELQETRGANRNRMPRINIVVAARDLVADMKAEGAPVQVTARGKIAWAPLAHRAGVTADRLRDHPRGRAIIEDALRDGDLVLGGVYAPALLMTPAQVEARVEELLAVVRGFDVEGGKVPESPERRGLIDWRYVASLTGREWPTMERHPRYRAAVGEIARRRGTLLPGLMIGADTLASLREAGLARVREEQGAAGARAVDATVANYKSAFDRVVAAAGIDMSEGSAVLFQDAAFERAENAVLAGYSNPRSSGNVRRLLKWWRDFRTARIGAAGLPESFGEALDTVMRRRGVMPTALAREIGCDRRIVQNWLNGHGVTASQVRFIALAEVALGLSRGTLELKMSATFRGSGHRAVATEWYNALPKVVRPLLPREAMGWPKDRLDAAVALVLPLVTKGTTYGKMHAAAIKQDYALPALVLSDRMRERMDDYVAYKSAPAVFPLVRPARARWKSKGTAAMRRRELAGSIRFACAPEPVGETPIGGLGIGVELQTFAWLAQVPLMLSYVGHRASRLAGVEVDGEPRGLRYGSCERSFVQHLVSLTNPAEGYLVQHPELVGELVPLAARLVPGRWDDLLKMFAMDGDGLLLGEADVALARSDWKSFVGRAHTAYLQVMAHIDDVMEVSRSPMEPVRGFVEADEPRAELLALMFEAERKWPCKVTQWLLHRLAVRDAAMMRLALITAFRPANLANLTYTGDDRGEIRRVDGVWSIHVNYRQFKNYGSSRLFGTRTARRDYHLELRDEAGLYDLLDMYFGEILPASRVMPGCTAAWVTRSGKPMCTRAWWDICRAYGRAHLAHNALLGTGLPGVVSMNPYCFRHIVASDTLKNGMSTNRLEEAAFALQTSEIMIQRHYGLLMPREAVRSSQDTAARAIAIARKRSR